MINPFFNLEFEPAMENLGEDYYDIVTPAPFPQHLLRFANHSLLPLLGLKGENITANDWLEAFGKFAGNQKPLALKYHGYQFGQYNPFLGDGRGFLWGQVRGADNRLYDFGTKGSGRTPYSRNADGRLTLKGGVREVIASETLHRLGVNTSRTFSLIETGESLWRGDEPSPTRSSVMVRLSHSHIRFGTFERLHYLQRADLIKNLLDHVIYYYYPHLSKEDNPYEQFYAELVQRVAHLASEWMMAGFCHGVLNTDNMSITGESFDYGPFAFINTYDPKFISAYFDYSGRYCYGNQPLICRLNLEKLQVPLSLVMSSEVMGRALEKFDFYYENNYQKLMLRRLGLTNFKEQELSSKLVEETVKLLKESQTNYHQLFANLKEEFNYGWQEKADLILENQNLSSSNFKNWQYLYHQALKSLSKEELNQVHDTLNKYNPKVIPSRAIIEEIWQPINDEDNWDLFNEFLRLIEG